MLFTVLASQATHSIHAHDAFRKVWARMERVVELFFWKQGRQFLVTKLDLGTHVAHTIPVKVNYYTAASNNVDINVTKLLEVSEDKHAHT